MAICVTKFSSVSNSTVDSVGFVDDGAIEELLGECEKMKNLNHLHVMTIKGICLDGGPVPFLILPYMANGSLLSYIRKEKRNLVVMEGVNNYSEELPQVNKHKSIYIITCMQLLYCLYSVIHSCRLLSSRNDSWICVYRWLRAWSIWPVRNSFIETWLQGTACMWHVDSACRHYLIASFTVNI